MSEAKQWLVSIGIPGIEYPASSRFLFHQTREKTNARRVGIERLADEFESRGFSIPKSLQYL